MPISRLKTTVIYVDRRHLSPRSYGSSYIKWFHQRIISHSSVMSLRIALTFLVLIAVSTAKNWKRAPPMIRQYAFCRYHQSKRFCDQQFKHFFGEPTEDEPVTEAPKTTPAPVEERVMIDAADVLRVIREVLEKEVQERGLECETCTTPSG